MHIHIGGKLRRASTKVLFLFKKQNICVIGAPSQPSGTTPLVPYCLI